MLAEVSMTWGHYTNLMGGVLCLLVAFGSKWRLKEKNKENSILLSLWLCVVISLIADSLAIWADGRPGEFCRFIVYFTNSWLFVACIANGFFWIMFMEEHIHGANSVAHMRVLQTICVVGVLILVINLYLPIVFAVNGNNVYERKSLFFIYFLIQICFLIDAMTMYVAAKYKLGGLSVYKVWIYIIPMLLGMFGQLFVYGTSLIWPGAAVATSIMIVQFNADDKYRDSITGLYDRQYIPVLNKKLIKFRAEKYTVIAIQIVGLEAVRSVQGDEVIDKACVEIARFLKKVIQPRGVISRYDSDFYVVVLNTVDSGVIATVKNNIDIEFYKLNKKNKDVFSFKAEMQHEIFDINAEDIDSVVTKLKDRI